MNELMNEQNHLREVEEISNVKITNVTISK